MIWQNSECPKSQNSGKMKKTVYRFYLNIFFEYFCLNLSNRKVWNWYHLFFFPTSYTYGDKGHTLYWPARMSSCVLTEQRMSNCDLINTANVQLWSGKNSECPMVIWHKSECPQPLEDLRVLSDRHRTFAVFTRLQLDIRCIIRWRGYPTFYEIMLIILTYACQPKD